jgi:hypothetical protein
MWFRCAAAVDRLAETAVRFLPVRRALQLLAGSAVVTVATLSVVMATALPGGSARTPEPAAFAPGSAAPAPPPSVPPHRPLAAAGTAPQISPPPPPPGQPAGKFTGWAIIDQRTGGITGSGNMAEVSTTASMIKAWIVADYLRRTAAAGRQPSRQRLDELELIIRDSHNEYAEALFRRVGAHESIERLIDVCQLTDSRPYRDYWSNTQLSPRDTARMGLCIADGRAAGPDWTDWLLNEMRLVRGAGDFGIRFAFPAAERSEIAIKNGWINRDYDGNWHVNCLAIGDGWTMGVMVRYPIRLGYEHGGELCRSLATDHLLPTLKG